MHSTISPLMGTLILVTLTSGIGGIIAIARFVCLKVMALSDDEIWRINRMGLPPEFVRTFARILTGAIIGFCLASLIGVFGVTIILMVSR